MIDDFITTTNKLTKSELLEEKLRLEQSIARIIGQLEKPHDRTDGHWKTNAKTALRYKQIELSYIKDRISLTNSDCFVHTAKRLLDQDTFNIIMEQCQQ